MTEARPSDETLARVLSGNPAPGEAEAVAAWAGSDPVRMNQLEQLRAAWSTSTPGATWDVDRAWSRVASQMTGDSPANVIPLPRAASPRTGLMWRMAAALLVAVGLTAVWYSQRPGPLGDSTVYVTADGERREVLLADGSVAVLAPRSTLTVPANFNTSERTLELEGEAWFSATHQENAPLIVATATHMVRDVGTVFTVSARAGDAVRVAVLEGEVAVRGRTASSNTEHHLVAGEAAHFADEASAPAWRGTNLLVDTLADWRDGTLDVTTEPANAVLSRLTEWYGVPITLTDTGLGSLTVTAALSLDSLDQALEVMALLLDVTVERDQGGVVLRPKP